MENIYIDNDVRELIKTDFIINNKNIKLASSITKGLNGILIIYAPWCENCILSKNMWESFASLFKYKFNIYALNCYNFRDKNQDLSYPLNIRSYPEYRFVDSSGKIHEYNGKKTENDIIKFIIENQ